MNPRQLIATADDFGASPEVNEAVVRAHREGILRFASLMVHGKAAADAVDKARALPGLGVGLHLVLCAESPAAWGLRLLCDRAARLRAETDIAEQMERFLAFGLTPTHLDSHFNAHVHPAVFPAVARLARRFAVRRVRWPAGELGPSVSYARARGQSLSPMPAALAGVYAALRVCLDGSARGLALTRAFGMLRSGLMSEDYAIWLLRRLPEGASEMYFHPSLEPGSGTPGVPTATHRSADELRTLLSPRVRQVLREEGIELLPPAR